MGATGAREERGTTREVGPARASDPRSRGELDTGASPAIPRRRAGAVLEIDGRAVRLTNLEKPFWPTLGVTKGDLLRYYAGIAPHLLPHLRDRAMVLKRYPDGAAGPHFFMKRAPSTRPAWIATCPVAHSLGVIDFPMIQDRPALLWAINLGCIDLHPWYARCDDVGRPDFLHFDLDPVPGAAFPQVLEAALAVRDGLRALGMPCFPKTTGARGMHLYVPIVRGPAQKQVWTFARDFAVALAARYPSLLTAEYRVARRPPGRVLIDYNQNAWGRTLAAVYSPRPRERPTVSTPVTWEEVERGVRPDRFTIATVPGRVARLGDLFAAVLAPAGRFGLERYL